MVTQRVDQQMDLKNEQWDLANKLLWSLKQIETATIYTSEEEKHLFLVSFQFYADSLITLILQKMIQSLQKNLRQ